jgi:hypothetical protein
MAVDTKRQEVIDFYFQKVQDEIKTLLKNDPKIKDDERQKFNDLIFQQSESDVRQEIEEYLQDAASSAVDTKIIAQELLSKFYTRISVNNFDTDSVNDIENTMVEKKLMNFSNFVKESNTKQIYFIANSSWFDLNPYDIEKITEIVTLFLDNDSVWTENQFGWENQPEVVCFLSNSSLVPKIVDKVNQEFDTSWIRANQKNW